MPDVEGGGGEVPRRSPDGCYIDRTDARPSKKNNQISGGRRDGDGGGEWQEIESGADWVLDDGTGDD